MDHDRATQCPQATRQVAAFLVLVLAWSGSASSALGQPSYPDCVADAACRALYEAARQRSAEENLPEALRLYRLGYDATPDPRLLFSIARLYHRLGQPAEAVSYYQRFVNSAFDDLEQKSKAREFLGQLQTSTPVAVAAVASPVAQSNTVSAVTERKPVYKKWWFWTILGSVAAVSVTGLVLGLELRSPAMYERNFN